MGTERSSPEDFTFFAKAGRASDEVLAEQVRRSLEDPCIQVVLQAVHGYLLILNSQRQILAANGDILDALHRDEPGCLVGLRPGEAMNCIHFTDGPDGCGTSLHCRTCGAVLAILASQSSGEPVTKECRLSAMEEGRLVARDYRVRSTPLSIGADQLTAFVLHDISSEKRREVLEQTFLHDFLNHLGGIEGWSRMLDELDSKAAAHEILALTETLKEEVVSHRTLLQAEGGDLVLKNEACYAHVVFEQLRAIFNGHPVRDGRQFDVAPAPDGAAFFTDRGLLLRVLINMIKNAFEATVAGGTVRVWFEWREGRPGFVVHNPGFIEEAVQPHLFERSFSTKADKGRGIGTYSMKLYGERYLGGTVSYSSDPAGGTRFCFFLPPDRARSTMPDAAAAVAAGPGASARSVERVLLVEDDEPVLRLASLFLRRLGYEVTACGDGVEAEKVFRASPAGFDLVLTDANMPNMSGLQLGRRLLEIRPDLPVILCTASGGGAAAEQAVRDGGFRGIVYKPYTLPTLAKSLRELLAD